MAKTERLSDGCRVQIRYTNTDHWHLHCKTHGDKYLTYEEFEGDAPTLAELVMYASLLGCIKAEVPA